MSTPLNLDEMLEKYGNTLVKFDSYYKYAFYFKGTALDGTIVSCVFGGSSEDIYRFEVDRETEIPLKDLSPSSVTNSNGQIYFY